MSSHAKPFAAALLAAGLTVASCGGDDKAGIPALADATIVAQISAADVDLDAPPPLGDGNRLDGTVTLKDSPGAEAGGDLPETDLQPGTDGPLVVPSKPDTFEPEEGGFGWPCIDNGDCLVDPFCVPSRWGSICSKSCIQDCPEGFTCKGLQIGGPDLVFLCIDQAETLCMPCNTNQDCRTGFGGDGAFCIQRGAEGGFCGSDCSNRPCPGGYACTDWTGPDGQARKQCLPGDGVCTCSQRAKDLGASTKCFVENSFGTCTGTRFCSPDGLSDCDADEPGMEICDDLDNNCDGETDNAAAGGVTCPLENEFGICPGTPQCTEGGVQCLGDMPGPEICDGKDNDCNDVIDDPFPDSDGDTLADCLDDDDDNDGIIDPDDNCQLVFNPLQENFDGDAMGDACDPDDDNDGVFDDEDCAPFDKTNYPGNLEVCDGKDNNCNGQKDEGICDDGNSCTKDKCSPDGGCTHKKLSGVPCDDGTVCTQVDICSNGTCQGGNPMICDDGNPCTTEKCNPVTGCFWSNNNDPCEDGNLCTEGDHCQNSSCKSGPLANCDDNNPCTLDACNPAQGCTHVMADGAGCIRGGNQCSTGQCVSGACMAQPTVCSKTVSFSFCSDVDVEGTCSPEGACIPKSTFQSTGCSSCGGICLNCAPFGSLCIPLSIFF